MRRPELGGHGEIEAGGHHAGDQEILVVQADVLADDGGVGGEAAAPQAVAEHHFALAAGLIFALPESRGHSTGWTPNVVKKLALTSVCMARSGSPPAPTMLAMPPCQVARFSIAVLSRRMSSRSAEESLFHSLGSSGTRCSTITRLSRCGKAMGFHNSESHHAENGGGGADAERQREHRGDGEARRFAQHALAVTDVLPQIHGLGLAWNTHGRTSGFAKVCCE